jgi:hypothetical protein
MVETGEERAINKIHRGSQRNLQECKGISKIRGQSGT